MRLLVQNGLDPSRATEIFSVPKRRIFAFRKLHDTEIIVDYSILKCQLPGVRGVFIFISKESDKMAKRAEEERAKDLGPEDERKKEKEERREERRTHIHTPQHIKTPEQLGIYKITKVSKVASRSCEAVCQ